MPQVFTSGQVAKQTGATQREVQWWADHLFKVPSDYRGFRCWAQWQVEEVAKLVKLRRFGIPLKDAVDILAQGIEWEHVLVATRPYAFVNGTLVYFTATARHAVDQKYRARARKEGE